MPLVVSMHGGRFAFCMCTSPAACGQWECFIRPRTCLCVPCYECFFSLLHPPSGPRCVPSSACNPWREPSHHHKHLAWHDDTGVTEEHGPGWRTSISTFHTLRHNMSAWLYLGCFSQLRGFIWTFFCQNITNERFVWLVAV